MALSDLQGSSKVKVVENALIVERRGLHFEKSRMLQSFSTLVSFVLYFSFSLMGKYVF